VRAGVEADRLVEGEWHGAVFVGAGALPGYRVVQALSARTTAVSFPFCGVTGLLE
jgi:hypothetical protein